MMNNSKYGYLFAILCVLFLLCYFLFTFFYHGKLNTEYTNNGVRFWHNDQHFWYVAFSQKGDSGAAIIVKDLNSNDHKVNYLISPSNDLLLYVDTKLYKTIPNGKVYFCSFTEDVFFKESDWYGLLGRKKFGDFNYRQLIDEFDRD